ncbi:MAG: hypothetical protein KBT11_07655 [Treponema sp.]|nr:hypothetical protein [Candidatus Treponema equifaecale]
MKLYFRKYFAAMAVLAVIFTACSSLQDVDVETVNFSGEIFEFEKRFAYIDAEFTAAKGNSKIAQGFVKDIENAITNPGLQKAAVARLYALDGCVQLNLGRTVEARKFLASSESSYKGDLFASVLFHRLNPQKSLALNANISEKSPEKALLVLEEALDLYKNKSYLEAVARFDSAFILLNSFYRDAYGEIRDKCWELRSISSENFGEDLLTLQKISVMQMILISEKDTDLLYNYTGGKKMSDRELYTKIAGSGLLNPVSAPLSVENSISSDYLVNKLIASRYLWNLYNARKNTQHLAAKYSVQYKKSGRKSPVKDVELENPDFDAVLGCVEKEILNLDDGVNFNGKREISAVEFNESLKKLK